MLRGKHLTFVNHGLEHESEELIRVVLGHRAFGLGTGQAIPVLVKAEKVPGAKPPMKETKWETISTCSKPPPAPTA